MRSSDNLEAVNPVASVDVANPVDEKVKDRILVVSVDYDSCFSGPRFIEALQHIEHLKGQGVYTKAYLDIISEIHKALIEDILGEAKLNGCTRIKVMIGSNRQALELDIKNRNNNHNGSCFEGMAMLAQYLASVTNIPVEADLRVYADALMDKPDGHHANVYFERAEMGEMPEEAAARMDTLRRQVRDHKYCMSFLQATNACLENPDSEVFYRFYDDLTSILNESEQQFSLANINDYLPSNLRSVTFSRYQDTIILTEVAALEEKIRKLSEQNLQASASHAEIELVSLAAKVSLSLAKVYNEYLARTDVQASLEEIRTKLVRVNGFHEKVSAQIKDVKQEIHRDLSQRPELVELVTRLSAMRHAAHPEYAPEKLEYIPGKEASGYLEDLQTAVEKKDNAILFKIFLDPNLMHNIRMNPSSQGFNSNHAEFKKLYSKLRQEMEDEALGELNAEQAKIETEKSAYDNVLHCLKQIPDDVVSNLGHLVEYIERSGVAGTTPTYAILGKGIETLNQVTYLLDTRNQPKIMKQGSQQNQHAVEYQCDEQIAEVQGMCNRHREGLYLDGDKMLTRGKEIVVNEITSRPVTTAILGAAESADRVVACLAPAVWQNPEALPSLQVLHGRVNRSPAEIVQGHFAKCGNDKTNFLATLRQLLTHKDCNRATIVAFFTEFKKLDGNFAFIHANKNKKWDAIRFKFKSNRNSGQDEHTFWHTDTFAAAVKLLKDAYVARADDMTANVESGNLLIDYHRGNKIAMPSQTATRKMGNK